MQDAVLDFLSAGPHVLTYRLGVQFREPLRPPPPANSVLAARYLRIQVASPPPQRVDGTSWEMGLVTSDGVPFDPASLPANGQATPLKGIAPLALPDPNTIVFDRWLAVPAVLRTEALTTTFAFDSADPKTTPLSFLSAFYPSTRIDGIPLPTAGVAYYTDGGIVFDRPVDTKKDGNWIAVSLERFFPPERASADYIVRVLPKGDVIGINDPNWKFPVTPAWTADRATSASRSFPASG
jgi:hypothetical protein